MHEYESSVECTTRFLDLPSSTFQNIYWSDWGKISDHISSEISYCITFTFLVRLSVLSYTVRELKIKILSSYILSLVSLREIKISASTLKYWTLPNKVKNISNFVFIINGSVEFSQKKEYPSRFSDLPSSAFQNIYWSDWGKITNHNTLEISYRINFKFLIRLSRAMLPYTIRELNQVISRDTSTSFCPVIFCI
jgi:hypothetical protein